MSYTSGLFARAARHVQQDDLDGIPANTQIAYGRKGAEFLQYCTTMFGYLDYPQTVTEEKVFGFLFYQAYRSRRRRGRKMKREQQEGTRPIVVERIFDADDYAMVMAKYNSNHNCEEALVEELEDPVGWDTVNQYLCSILKILRHQRSQNANNLTKEHIRSERVTQLLRVVQVRKKKIKKMRFDEKIDHALSPYMNVQNIERIEDFLFSKNQYKPSYHVAALRDRFCFLMTHGGVLRGESLFKCELSDLCDLIKYDEGTHACQILIMQIITGKTNGQKTLYGRVMRHRNVNMCPIGALGFYLMARFHSTAELAHYDFASNATWFNVKLLTDCNNTGNYQQSITDQAYASTMKQACKALGITSKHFVHFGRGTGAVACEMQEVDPQYIKMIGNWNLDVREDRYSSKLPLKAMRALAGHSQDKGGFFLPRCSLDPPPELRRQVFPFLDKAMNTTVNSTPKPTAQAFFELLLNLQCVVLQDAAILLHQGRKNRLFLLPVFATTAFHTYQAALMEKVSVEAGMGATTSIERSIDVALPGVRDRLQNLHSEVHNASQDIRRIQASVTTFRQQQGVVNNQLHHFLQHMHSFQLPAAPPTEATTDTPDDEDPPETRKKYLLFRTHKSVSSMWNEWFGLGVFDDIDFPGGIEDLEKIGSRWRKHYNTADQKHFSRLKCIVDYVKGRVVAGESLEAILEEGDNLMKTKAKTLSTLHTHLQKTKSFQLPTTNQLPIDSWPIPKASNTMQAV